MKNAEPRPAPWWLMLALVLAIGVIASLGAAVFRGMIAFFHNLLFLGQFSFEYDASLHTPPSPWGPLVILVPVVAAVGVAFLVQTFAPEAKGHGVPEVIDAIWFGGGRIRPIVTVVKSIASALSIGSGGSVGREGPIVQIGSAFGSMVGQWVPMPTRQRVTLIAAGAGAGIAATFNTPVGGLLFAVELMLPVIQPRSLLAVGLATATATGLGRLMFGDSAAFEIPALVTMTGPPPSLWDLLVFPLFGVLVGLLATAFVRSIYWFEDAFDALPGNYYRRHMFGMLLVGVILYAFISHSDSLGQPNHYYVKGVGYATIMDVLSGQITAPFFLLLLVAAKLLVTCLTLGSGASGRVFSPSLFLGAVLGGGVGSLLNLVFPDWNVPPATVAMAGMAGMVGGATGASLTAMVMVFEMTWNYGSILPVIVTTVVAGAVRQALCPPTIYTLKLLRRGHVVPQGLQAWVDTSRRAQDVMATDFVLLESEANPDAGPVRQALLNRRVLVVAGEDGHLRGVFESYIPRDPHDASSRAVLRHSRYIVVRPFDRFADVLRAMDQAEASVALVMREGGRTSRELVGVVTDRDIGRVSRSLARLLG
jgi:CIC family chloride channel protein